MSQASHPPTPGADFPVGKVAGRRPGPTPIEDADRLLPTAWSLRGTDKLVPQPAVWAEEMGLSEWISNLGGRS